MKTLTLAFFAASLAAAPLASVALAQDATPAAAVAAPANKTEVSKKYAVGDRMPGMYVARGYLADVAALKLPAAPVDHKWYHVTDNAYLLNVRTDRIVQIVGVPAKG